MTKKQKRELVKQPGAVEKGAIGAAAAFLAGVVVGAHPLVGAGVAAGVAAFGEGLLGRVLNHKQRSAERWWMTVLDDPTRSPEEVAEAIHAKLEDPNVAETILRSIRDLTAVTDEAVIPALGLLAREYVDAGRRPDRFLRTATAFLSVLSAEEFADACALFALLHRHADENGQDAVRIDAVDRRINLDRPKLENVRVLGHRRVEASEINLAYGADLTRALVTHGLAYHVDVVGVGSPVVAMPDPYAFRLARLARTLYPKQDTTERKG